MHVKPRQDQSAFDMVRWLFKEAVGLGLTYAIAVYVDSGYGLGFWTIMGSISLARWLRVDVVAQERQKVLRLLFDLSQIQGEFHAMDFNAGVVRERLYHIARRGIVFSPCV